MLKPSKFKARGLLLGLALAGLGLPLAAETGDGQGITRADVVEQLCRDNSEETLDELGITAERWQAEKLNDQGQFFIEGLWVTNAGHYLVECQLRFGAREEQMSMQLHKERRDS